MLFEFKQTEFFTSHGDYLLNTTLSVPGVGFSVASLNRAKIRILSISKFLFIVVIVISILLKTVFLQTSIHIQSLMKSLWLSDKDKITFKAIEKHRYGL